MEKFKAVFTNKWFIQGLGLFGLALLIWFIGPGISLFERDILATVSSRLLLILMIICLWVANIAWTKNKNKKNNEAMLEQLGQNDDSDIHAQSSEIDQRFGEALKLLEQSTSNTKSGAHLYELPWYIIIGPPGSGKTTALINSGLDFPLEGEFGKDSIRGNGGTRHCDWWFTTEAVLIDTAGRFTTQDSHESVDKAAWQKFVDLLKQYRKQRPINGALVAVSITDIFALSEHERANYAHTIRRRIDELINQLGINFPVYFMFTKCDLVAGFNEFFANLTHEEQGQVWGDTFEFADDANSGLNVDDYGKRYDQLMTRLNSQILTKVNRANDKDTSAILGFPSQMASLKEPITLFLKAIFSGNPYQKSALLRGVYYTSGTQEGTPIDRLLGSMAANWGVKAHISGGLGGKGRSYFVRRLLKEVVIPESDLAGTDQKVVKRRRIMQGAAYVGAIAALVAAIGLWTMSYQQNLNHITVIGDHIALAQDVAVSDDMVGADFSAVLDELNEMRAASQVFDNSTMLAHAGLYQGDGLGKRVDGAYLKALENKLLPMIIASLQERIIESSNNRNTASAYEWLKGYLMYTTVNNNAGVEDDNAFQQALSRIDWQLRYGATPSVIEQLTEHQAYLLEHSALDVKITDQDQRIISKARGVLSRSPLSEQVYQSVKYELQLDRTKDLSFSDLTGDLGIQVFESKSGKPLVEQFIPGMFTKKDFYARFIKEYPSHAKEYLENNWVLGQHSANVTSVAEGELKDRVYRHYYDDYIKHWSEFIADIKLKSIEKARLDDGLAIIDDLSSIGGPFEVLLNNIAAQTDLSQPIPTGEAAQGLADVSAQVSSTASRVVNKVNRLARDAKKAGFSASLGKRVTEKFSSYHRIAEKQSGSSRLERMIEEMGRFSTYLEENLKHGDSDRAALEAVKARKENRGINRFNDLRRHTKNSPREVEHWINSLNQKGWSLVLTRAHQELNTLWQTEVVNYYQEAIAGRYPHDVNAKVELELRDFAKFFRPGGIVDQFITLNISPFINIKSKNWHNVPLYKQSSPLSDRAIKQLQDANRITQLFFPPRALEPKISFSMKPVDLNLKTESFRFDFGDKNITYSHGAIRAKQMIWPLDFNNEQTRIQFTAKDGSKTPVTQSGPWSLFKMLDLAQLSRTAQGSVYQVTFSEKDNQSGKDHQAIFELRVDSEFNPLGARLLQNFNLPTRL